MGRLNAEMGKVEGITRKDKIKWYICEKWPDTERTEGFKVSGAVDKAIQTLK